MHVNLNNRETVNIPQTIIEPTKSIIVTSLVTQPTIYVGLLFTKLIMLAVVFFIKI